MAEPIEDEIQKEVKAHKILIYGKGTKTMPMCGFTRETMQFFEKYGYPYELIDVLSQPTKREALTKMTNWPTLPKVFINQVKQKKNKTFLIYKNQGRWQHVTWQQAGEKRHSRDCADN